MIFEPSRIIDAEHGCCSDFAYDGRCCVISGMVNTKAIKQDKLDKMMYDKSDKLIYFGNETNIPIRNTFINKVLCSE